LFTAGNLLKEIKTYAKSIRENLIILKKKMNKSSTDILSVEEKTNIRMVHLCMTP